MLIDTHAHLYVEDYKDDLANIVQQSKDNNIVKVLLPNIDQSTISALKKASDNYPDFFLSMMGLHPTIVKENYKSQLDVIYNELYSTNRYVAVGEIGIDLYWDTTYVDEQTESFETQLRWSIDKNLPVSIHSRNSHKEIMKSLRRVGENKLLGVFHSFSGNVSELDELLSFENFYIGINGIVTFKNSTLSTVLKNCPMERIVLETDCPYLTPVPFRGKRNDPIKVKYVAEKIAEIKGISIEEVAAQTMKNGKELFRIEN